MNSDDQASPPYSNTNRLSGARLPFAWCRAKFADMSILAHVLWMILFGFTVASSVSVGIWLLAGRPSVKSLVEDLTLLELIRVALLVTGGVGGIVFLVVNYRRQKSSERAEHRDNRAAEREDSRLFSERFESAGHLLGGTHATTRIAGIFALAQLADEWVAGRTMCIDILCAPMRVPHNPSDTRARLSRASEATAEAADELFERQQVQNAVGVVVRNHLRLEPIHGVTWHGQYFDFSGSTLNGIYLSRIKITGAQVDFSGVVFSGDLSDFSGAQFSGGTVNFQRADFRSGRVDFEGAEFTGSVIDFRGARFSGGTVDFRGARNWSVPPIFDHFPDGRPEGLLLPRLEEDS